MGSRPRLVCIPSTDSVFAEHANALFEQIAPDLAVDGASERFTNQLRLTYPTAVVREREELAELWPGNDPVWYVIRRAYASRIVASVDIPAERSIVYRIYVERMPEWQVVVQLRPVKRPHAAVAAEYAAAYEFLGRTLNGRLRVVDASPPWAVRVEAEGMGVKVWYVTTFRPTETGTKVEVAGDYVLPSRIIPAAVGRLFAERRIAQDIERAHAALRELCVQADAGGTDASAELVSARAV